MANVTTQFALLTNGAATSAAFPWPGGDGVITGEATWGGGNIRLQVQTINGTWVDVSSSAHTLSANGMFPFTLPRCLIRINVTTATAVFAYALGTAEP